MDRLPQRDDLIYKEIEEFQDYELTNCVAYEMAIRNENISALVNKYLKKRFVFSYTEEKNEVNGWIRITLPFALILMTLMLVGLPFNFIITGKWYYGNGEKSRILNWFRQLRLV